MSLKVTHEKASVVMLTAKLKPLENYKSSGSPWKCKCQVCNSICKPTYGNIKQGRGGCVKCGIKKRAALKLLKDDITVSVMLEKGLRPLEPYKRAGARWKCECLKCRRVAYPTYGNVRSSKSKKKGCAICIGIKVDPIEVQEKMLDAGLKTYGSYPGKDSPWKCKCLSCGVIVFPTWNNIRNGVGGCGKCRYLKSAKSNRTPEKDAVAKMIKAGLQPLELYVNKDTPWKCICLKCKNTVYPRAGNISRGQGGCSFCRETGLNHLDPAYIYLISHEEHQSIKIGVSNNDSKPNRLRAHRKQGWTTFKVKNYSSGERAEFVETKVLRWLRKDLLLRRHLAPRHMPQGGHSETVDASEIGLPTIWAKVEQLSRVIK